jgi:hypothetical protein
MRLWSVHPRYLDTVGLVACWREALLAQKVLTGTTRGYRHHPQLERFLPGSALATHARRDPRSRPDVPAERTDPDETSGAAAGGAAAGGAAAAGAAGVAAVAGAVAADGWPEGGPAAAAGVAAVAGGWPAGGWPGDLVVAYLHGIADEADARGFAFDRSRIAGPRPVVDAVEVTDGQLAHEWAHLRTKLADRSPDVAARWAGVVRPDAHPCFVVVPGSVAPWEAAPRA